MVDEIISDFGRVDILVLNGGPSSAGELVTDTEINEVISVVSTHAFGAFYLCKLLVPQMRLLGRGDILMMSSVSTSSIGGRGAPYNMAKVALEALAKTLAAEERPHGVRVNVVAPGLISTDMGDRYANMVAGVNRATDLDGVSPFGRVGRVEDVANLVSFLVSDQASYLSNQRITVDGGAGLG
jgi:3-oxoacyl-[acyl-carrier protein] reductase